MSATQLRDDLLSMLVAGHETTGSALTWTMYLLAQNPDKMAKVCQRGWNPCADRDHCLGVVTAWPICRLNHNHP